MCSSKLSLSVDDKIAAHSMLSSQGNLLKMGTLSHIFAILSLSEISHCFKNNILIHDICLQGFTCFKPCQTLQPYLIYESIMLSLSFSTVVSVSSSRFTPDLSSSVTPDYFLLPSDFLHRVFFFSISTN